MPCIVILVKSPWLRGPWALWKSLLLHCAEHSPVSISDSIHKPQPQSEELPFTVSSNIRRGT